MRHKRKPGYFHYCYFFLGNCTHTSDWVGLFWLLCCLWKSVTNSECRGTISLYSIWPAPVARGNTPGIAFSFFLSYFLISPCFCRLSVPFYNWVHSKPHHPATESVCGSTVVARSPFYTAVTIRPSGGNRNVHETCPHAVGMSLRIRAEGKCWRFLDMTWLSPNEHHAGAGVNSCESFWTHPCSIFQKAPIVTTICPVRLHVF